LVGKPEEKRTFCRHRHRWNDNIKMDLQEVVYEGINWIDVAEDRNRWQGTCECGNEPSGSIK
jgi:hypothetical protein